MSKKRKKKDEGVSLACTHISELEELHEALRAHAPAVPYWHHFSVDPMTGNFQVVDETELVPEEALRLGQFLVDFYGPK